MPTPDLYGLPLNVAQTKADLYHRSGELEKAEALYREILRLYPNDAAALNNFGRVLQDMGTLPEAVAMFRRATELAPEEPLPHKNLGVVLCQTGRLDESFAVFRRHAELTYNTQPSAVPHKAQHDAEQREYLGQPSGFHLADGNRIAGRAVSANASLDEITAKWRASDPQITVIDDFLTPEALEKLRRFCLESTIWRQPYIAGYLGAMPEHGIGTGCGNFGDSNMIAASAASPFMPISPRSTSISGSRPTMPISIPNPAA
jgi:tetratricopeptide (TPR) repeat protein